MGIAKVTRNYQVTIPRDIRRMQNINIGDSVLFAIEGNKVDFFKMEKEKLIEEIAGIWKGKIKGDSINYIKNIRRGWKKREKRFNI